MGKFIYPIFFYIIFHCNVPHQLVSELNLLKKLENHCSLVLFIKIKKLFFIIIQQLNCKVQENKSRLNFLEWWGSQVEEMKNFVFLLYKTYITFKCIEIHVIGIFFYTWDFKICGSPSVLFEYLGYLVISGWNDGIVDE